MAKPSSGELQWLQIDKNQWIAEGYTTTTPPRIKKLDAKIFAVYRDCRYLGCEPDLDTAKSRAQLNQRSETNREMDWQRAHPDEQPLGLRLTEGERKQGWQDTPPRAAPRSTGGRKQTTENEVETKLPSRATAAGDAQPGPVATKSKGDGKGRDGEIAKMLKRGCTSEEVLKLTGWKAVSMPAMAKKLGLKLRIDKSCKPFKYYEEE